MEPFEAPVRGALDVTVTSSPWLNGTVGMKLTPRPSECLARCPACAPVRDPVTLSAPRSLADPPRNEMVVAGDAVRVSFVGKTSTVRPDGTAARDPPPPPRTAAATAAMAARGGVGAG